jgi:hypothetical protein
VRLFDCKYASSLHWGKGRIYRFDDPQAEYGVLYIGSDECCAFIETFGDSRNAATEIEVAREDLQHECIATIRPIEELHVVDLTGPGLSNIGADGRLCAGDDYALSQLWSRALWCHPDRPDGLLYRARHDQGRTSLALFKSDDQDAPGGLIEEVRGSLLARANMHLLRNILSIYRVNVLP